MSAAAESFSAAHQLCDPDLSDAENRRLFGKCANLHGRNYIPEVVVADALAAVDVQDLADDGRRRLQEQHDVADLACPPEQGKPVVETVVAAGQVYRGLDGARGDGVDPDAVGRRTR